MRFFCAAMLRLCLELNVFQWSFTYFVCSLPQWLDTFVIATKVSKRPSSRDPLSTLLPNAGPGTIAGLCAFFCFPFPILILQKHWQNNLGKKESAFSFFR